MTPLLTMGQAVSLHAHLTPDKIGARDLSRSMTFSQWEARSRRLANGLLGLGLAKGDRVAILAYNCVEWLEIYAATALAGLVMVPINFRLTGPEIAYIVDNSEAKAIIAQADFVEVGNELRATSPIPPGNYVAFGTGVAAGWVGYEKTIAAASDRAPDVDVRPEDTWAFIYTSGTTGKPKGAMRSHASHALLGLATFVDLELSRRDTALLVMPMCHANSLFFASSFTYGGAACCVYDAKSFEPEHLLRTLATEKATFTSLVPTHYIMMLGLPEAVKAQYDVDSVSKLLISSAPARRDTKLAIMAHFRNSQLLEMYGSSEAGWATLLRPDEQLSKLGSVGRELTGCQPIKLLDDSGAEVPDGEVGEIFSYTPWCFDGYWQLPEKTAEAFRGPYLSVGDLGRRDGEGYIHLVDRKNNMIISGGENIYPSEVENLLGSHPAIKDVAVIGKPHEKWGEAVHAVVVLRDGIETTQADLLAWCAGKIAGYKRPRSVAFIRDDEMPRTATGKILHRVLKERF